MMALVLGAIVGALAVACSPPDHPTVRVINDLAFSISVGGCEGKGLLADPIRISEGETKDLTPGSACLVYGPTGKGGPLNVGVLPGPYIGCILLPPERGDELLSLLVSEARRDIDPRTCDTSVESIDG